MPRTEVSGSQIKDSSVALSAEASPTGASDVTGVLPAANGGTGLASPGASGNVLTSDGTAWTSSAPTGGGGGGSGSTAPTADTLALRDADANLYADNFIAAVESTASTNGSKTLTIASPPIQRITGVLQMTVRLPTTGVLAGQSYLVINASSSGSALNIVQASNGTQIISFLNTHTAELTALVNTPTTPAHWRLALWPNAGVVVANANAPLSQFSVSTSAAIGVGTIELGHASDTTLSRSAAGTLAVEGVVVPTISSTNTLSNKTLAAPVIQGFNEATTTATVSNAYTFVITASTQFIITLTANTTCTFTMPAVSTTNSFTVQLRQPAATGNGAASFLNVRWPTNGVPTITTTAGRMDIINFLSDGTNWYGSYVQGYIY